MTLASCFRTMALLTVCSALPACANQTSPVFSPYNGGSIERTTQELRLVPVWQYEMNPKGIAGFKPVEPYGAATTRNGVAVFATFAGKVHGLEMRSGELLWSVDLKESPGSSPTIYDGMAYLGVSDGRILALNTQDGEEVWSKTLDTIIHGQPTVHDGVLYVVTSEEALVTFDAHTGDKLWTYRHPRIAELEIQGGGRPAVIDRSIYVGFSNGTLHRVSRQGDRVWSADLSHGRRRMVDVDSPAVEYKDMVIAVSHSGGVHAIDKETGAIAWTLDQQGVQEPLLVDNTLILTTTGGRIFWVHADSGRVLRELELERPGLTAPLQFTEDTFAVADADRGVFLIGISDSRLEALFESTVGVSGQMALWDDMLVILTNRGMAYGLKAGFQ